jgi:hypothetical protein
MVATGGYHAASRPNIWVGDALTPRMRHRLAGATAFIAALAGAPAAAFDLTVDAAPPLAAAADRVRRVDVERLRASLGAAGLDLPARAHVTLVAEDDPRARDVPQWIVGVARSPHVVVIFAQRVNRFPYQTLDSIVLHEIAHLALTARAGGRPLPRWFHEGVAMSIEGGWQIGRSARLLFAAIGEPTVADLAPLFASEAQPSTELAYLLSGAVVERMRDAHGAAVPGAIAALVAEGVPFPRAFEQATGETPAEVAARAWQSYRRWTAWLVYVTAPGAIWNVILVLAFAAFFVRLYRKARRRQWDEEDDGF